MIYRKWIASDDKSVAILNGRFWPKPALSFFTWYLIPGYLKDHFPAQNKPWYKLHVYPGKKTRRHPSYFDRLMYEKKMPLAPISS